MKAIHQPIKKLFEICDLMCEVPVTIVPESVMGRCITKTAKEFASQLRANGMSTVLDLACGDGRLTIPLAKHGFRITAVDISQAALNRLMERAHRHEVADLIEVRKADVLTTFPGEKYDTVVCTDVFQYFDKSTVLHLLDNIKRMTVEGGYNYIRMFADIQRTRGGRPLIYDGTMAFSRARADTLLEELYATWDVIAWKHLPYKTRWPPTYLDSASNWKHLPYHMEAVAVEVIARKCSREAV